MTTNYFKNMAGCRLTDAQRGDIPHPHLELITHVTTKTAQAGVIIGAGIIGPISCIAQGKKDCASIEKASFKYGKGGLMVGLVLGPVLTLARTMTLDNQGILDRSYQLRFNRNQCFVDRLSIAGALAGTGVAHVMGKDLAVGALFGFGGGCVCAGIINTIF